MRSRLASWWADEERTKAIRFWNADNLRSEGWRTDPAGTVFKKQFVGFVYAMAERVFFIRSRQIKDGSSAGIAWVCHQVMNRQATELIARGRGSKRGLRFDFVVGFMRALARTNKSSLCAVSRVREIDMTAKVR